MPGPMLGPGYATEQNRYSPALIEPTELWGNRLCPNNQNAYDKGEKRCWERTVG